MTCETCISVFPISCGRMVFATFITLLFFSEGVMGSMKIRFPKVLECKGDELFWNDHHQYLGVLIIWGINAVTY